MFDTNCVFSSRADATAASSSAIFASRASRAASRSRTRLRSASSESAALAFNAGKNATLKAAEAFLGHEAVFFSATDDLIKHNRNPPELIAAVDKQLAKSPYAYVYGARDQQPDHDPANHTSECQPRFVAMFLLAVEEGAFLGCNGWIPAFGLPLGKPLAKAAVMVHEPARVCCCRQKPPFNSGYCCCCWQSTVLGAVFA